MNEYYIVYKNYETKLCCDIKNVYVMIFKKTESCLRTDYDTKIYRQ